MLLSVFLALFVPCAAMSAVFIVYICLLWYADNRAATVTSSSSNSKTPPQTGLSTSDLKKLPTITGQGLVLEAECAVCLDEIGPSDLARLLPACNHGFHLQCADTWISKHSSCPLCRLKIEPPTENPC